MRAIPVNPRNRISFGDVGDGLCERLRSYWGIVADATNQVTNPPCLVPKGERRCMRAVGCIPHGA
jgi:hypothetical protein